MVDPTFLQHLRCPVTGSPLRLLEADALTRINDAITQRRAVNQIGDVLEQPLSDALSNADQSLLYPVWDDIPSLIPEEALPMTQFSDGEGCDGGENDF